MQSVALPSPPADVLVMAARIRKLRSRQAWVLLYVAVASILSGGVMLLHPPTQASLKSFVSALGFEFVIWGGIDLIFAITGTVQSARTERKPITDATAADDRAGRDKLLKALRFNHKLNIGYLVTAAALFAWAIVAQSATLYGHGTGVLTQGGFLFFFDLYYVRAFEATN